MTRTGTILALLSFALLPGCRDFTAEGTLLHGHHVAMPSAERHPAPSDPASARDQGHDPAQSSVHVDEAVTLDRTLAVIIDLDAFVRHAKKVLQGVARDPQSGRKGGPAQSAERSPRSLRSARAPAAKDRLP